MSISLILCGERLQGPSPTCALRGPAAILFISRDTCSDSIAKLFLACFSGCPPMEPFNEINLGVLGW